MPVNILARIPIAKQKENAMCTRNSLTSLRWRLLLANRSVRCVLEDWAAKGAVGDIYLCLSESTEHVLCILYKRSAFACLPIPSRVKRTFLCGAPGLIVWSSITYKWHRAFLYLVMNVPSHFLVIQYLKGVSVIVISYSYSLLQKSCLVPWSLSLRLRQYLLNPSCSHIYCLPVLLILMQCTWGTW